MNPDNELLEGGRLPPPDARLAFTSAIASSRVSASAFMVFGSVALTSPSVT